MTSKKSIRSISEGLSRVAKAKRTKSNQKRRRKTCKMAKKQSSKSSNRKVSNVCPAKRRRTTQ